ncbi:glycosyltransferase family 4 protein [Polynucleobacter sp. MWH-UH35A]|uniref:glycosyltransferase family 4 protein n=1 Tax=Polynucleobacter sp. MWH-UH35A TaxID=1855619 RepID=UPI001BFD2F3A|nr:glycosyltransferase family 4 protein [Polynucleobacter sp. MWH-UH35A]QWD60441.1 glycosyltransferase family 4 protein [Polynucleobacter sp. MWH-UH35A]
MTWKDMGHPQAGGAELVNEELAKRLILEGHQVKFLVGGWHNCKEEEERDGYQIVRLGSRYTVYLKAFFYFQRNLKDWPDLVIDECNTIPFFAKFYVSCKTVFMIQQLARQVWFYQLPFPFSLIGYFLEPFYLRLFRDQKTFTFAESTKQDLLELGFKEDLIRIISETFTINPVEKIEEIQKPDNPTILFFSALREMKRPDHVIKAFEHAKPRLKNLKLIVGGDGFGRYAARVKRMIANSPYSDDIQFLGSIRDEKLKCKIMQSAHYICCTSVREGWGIIVSEAGSQGTPAIVYDIHGLRDAVENGLAGIIVKKNSPESMAESIISAFQDHQQYGNIQFKAHKLACSVNISRTYDIFFNFLK